MHFQPLGMGRALEVEQVRPGPDDRDQAHDQFLADRIDRRVGHLREVLLEVREQELRLVGQRRDRRVVAHGADRLFAGRRHWRHQDFQVLLRVAERLLAIEQRQVGNRRGFRRGRQLLEHDLGAVEPFAIRMALGQRAFSSSSGMSRPSSRSTSSILPGCSRHLVTMSCFRNRQHADFRGHDDAVVLGDDVARRPQAVAVERGADLPAVGKRDRCRAVPRLHQRGVVFVERAALFIHQRIAGPRFRNHHHHRVRERIAAHGEEFERVVEAGGVGLALVRDRPELTDIVAEFRR